MRGGRVGEKKSREQRVMGRRSASSVYVITLPTYLYATHLSTGTGLQWALQISTQLNPLRPCLAEDMSLSA